MTTRPVAQSFYEYGRGVVGGLLFSLPLLYTAETWQAGFSASSPSMILYIVNTFALLLGYNRYAGIRYDASWVEVVIDSVEEMGLGIVVAAGTLWLLGRITLEVTLTEVMGKIVVEAMVAAIGVSVGTAQLGMSQDDSGGQGERDQGSNGQSAEQEVHFGGQMVIALCGAVLFAANIAVTDEVVIIALSISLWEVLGLALLSIALGGFILYYSQFIGSDRLVIAEGILDVVIGIVVMYAIALMSSALLLWFFGRFDGLALITCVVETVVLSAASTLGASAGRLLLQ